MQEAAMQTHEPTGRSRTEPDGSRTASSTRERKADDHSQPMQEVAPNTSGRERKQEVVSEDGGEPCEYKGFRWYLLPPEEKKIPAALADHMKHNVFLLMQRDPRCVRELALMVVPHSHPYARGLHMTEKVESHLDRRWDCYVGWSVWVYSSDKEIPFSPDCILDDLDFPDDMLRRLDDLPLWGCEDAVETWEDLMRLITTITSDYAEACTEDMFPPFIPGAYVGVPVDETHWFIARRT